MIIGVWAYLDNNIGDDLMVKLLAENFNEHLFYIYSDKTVVKNTFKDLNNVVIKKLNELDNDLNSINVFVSIGGSIFNDLNRLGGKIARVKKIILLHKFKRKKIKIATIGCNLGPYNDNIGIMLTKLELRMNDLVTVRDSSSYDLIKRFKCIKNYHLADDIVYLLTSQTGFGQKDTSIGITAYRSLKQNECNFDNYLALSKIIDCYVSKTNNVVKLFAFDSENENDISAAYHIYELSNSKSHIQIVPYLGNMKTFLEIFFSCSRHISIRFHSAILSDLEGIPFLPIAYSNKMLNFLTDNNYEGDIFMLDKFKIENIDVEKIVQKLISGEGLFLNTDKKKEARKHFMELEKLINHY